MSMLSALAVIVAVVACLANNSNTPLLVSAWIPQPLSTSHHHYSRTMTSLSASSSTTASKTTSSNPKPKLPIPPPILSDTPGTWAYDTMSRRVDEEILQRTLEDNAKVFASEEFKDINEKFEALRKDLQTSAKLRMLDELPKDASPERQREWNEWKDILQPFLDKDCTWLSAPWMVTEFYVYRRLIEAIGYWDKDTPGYLYDPFVKQKRAGLESSVGSVRKI